MTGPALSLIVTNGRIRTGNPARPWATAIAIDDGKLAVIGTAAEILKMARSTTRIIDAGGRAIELPAGAVTGDQVAVTVSADGGVEVRRESRDASRRAHGPMDGGNAGHD